MSSEFPEILEVDVGTFPYPLTLDMPLQREAIVGIISINADVTLNQFIKAGIGIAIVDDLVGNHTISVVGGGGEFFGPWTAPHDGGDQQFFNVGSIIMNDGSQLIFSGASGTELISTGLITDNLQITIGGNIAMVLRKPASGITNIVLGEESLQPTDATSGFVYLPVTAGVPTGIPAQDFPQKIPIVVDSTNQSLYMYVNSAWVPTGEINTASNLLPDEFGLWAGKTASDLEFKSLIAGSNITLSADANGVTITGAAVGSPTTIEELTDVTVTNPVVGQFLSIVTANGQVATWQNVSGTPGSTSFADPFVADNNLNMQNFNILQNALAITYDANIALDFDAPNYQTIELEGDTSLSTINSKEDQLKFKIIRFHAVGAQRTVNMDFSWQWITKHPGSSQPIPQDAYAILSLNSWGNGTLDVTAVYGLEVT